MKSTIVSERLQIGNKQMLSFCLKERDLLELVLSYIALPFFGKQKATTRQHLKFLPNSLGFTLLEFLVALGLNALLFATLIDLYAFAYRSFKQINKAAMALEEGRFACCYLRKWFAQCTEIRGLSYKEVKNKAIASKAFTDVIAGSFSSISGEKKSILYIGKPHYMEKRNENYSLYVKIADNPAIEIAKGISDLSILYGIKCATSENICRYVNAENNTGWERVASAKIRLKSAAKEWRLYVSCKAN